MSRHPTDLGHVAECIPGVPFGAADKVHHPRPTGGHLPHRRLLEQCIDLQFGLIAWCRAEQTA